MFLPADLFGNCATVNTVAVPVFDKGFNAQETAATGRFVGVSPTGPAYAAGLRDGRRLLARIGGLEGDSRVLLAYRVSDHGKERVIRYKPEGHAIERLQDVVLEPAMTAAERAACTRAMSGGALRNRA